MQEDIFKVNEYELDKEQKQVVLSNSKNILVIAGAGSGKSMTSEPSFYLNYLKNKKTLIFQECIMIAD